MKELGVTFHCGSGKNAIKSEKDLKSIDAHNNRKYKNKNNQELDPEKSHENVVIVGTDNIIEDVKKVYKDEFSEAVYDYNMKQKREDRKILDYYNQINNDKQTNLAVEMIFQLGDYDHWKDKSMEDKKKMVSIYSKAVDILKDKNIITAQATVHMDESSPHLHLIAVPIADNNKRGLSKQVSQNKVLTIKAIKEIREEIEKVFISEYKKTYNEDITLKKGSELPDHLDVKKYKKAKEIMKVAKEYEYNNSIKDTLETELENTKEEIKEIKEKLNEAEEEKENKIDEIEMISSISNDEAEEEIELKEVKKTKKIKIKSIEEVEDYLQKVTEKKRQQYKFIEMMLNSKYVEVKNLNVGRLAVCGDFLMFLKSASGGHRLKKANLCENRFCPLCSNVRARKNAVIILELLQYAREIKKVEFIFITLTAPNVVAEKLDEEITKFNKAFKELMRSKEFLKISKGYIRKLEVTYNQKANTYHPHFHVIIAVNKSYFTSRDYINIEMLKQLWRKYKQDETIEAVDMQKVRMNSVKEVMEMATYSAKSKDLFENGQEVFDTFYNALRGKQEITYAGLFKDLKKLRDSGELEIEKVESLKELQEKAVIKVWHKWLKENKEYKKLFEQELTEEEQEIFYNLDLTNIKIN